MKTVASLDDVKRLALAAGAEVVTPLGRFNSERATVAGTPASVTPLRPPATPASTLASPPASRQEIDALMAGHARAMQAQLTDKQAQIDRLQAACDALRRQAWHLSIAYDADGAITEVTQRPA